jgi:hypothetical protein
MVTVAEGALPCVESLDCTRSVAPGAPKSLWVSPRGCGCTCSCSDLRDWCRLHLLFRFRYVHPHRCHSAKLRRCRSGHARASRLVPSWVPSPQWWTRLTNDSRISCGEAPRACGPRGMPVAATNDKSAGAIRKRHDAVRLARKEALQRRERQTARRQLLAGVGRRPSLYGQSNDYLGNEPAGMVRPINDCARFQVHSTDNVNVLGATRT